MAYGTESERTRDLCRELATRGIVHFSAVASEKTIAGWPDRYISFSRWHGWCEFKRWNGVVSPKQRLIIAQLNSKQPGSAFFVFWSEEQKYGGVVHDPCNDAHFQFDGVTDFLDAICMASDNAKASIADTYTSAATMRGVPRSSQWTAVRAKHLLQHPSCAVCGRTTQLNVHHVKPYHLFPDLELDPANLITLCEGATACHFTFGHLGNWQYANDTVRSDAAEWSNKFADVRSW